MLPHAVSVAVFDTSFHQTLPPENYIYSVPYEWYEKWGVRRYGAHGTSHRYVTQRAAEILERPYEQLKLISCHLGNGSSICAVQNGQSFDTSMGFTPLAGLTMGTRSGDVDPSLVGFVKDKLGITTGNEMVTLLNHEAGLKGISGISSDMRDILAQAAAGNDRPSLPWTFLCGTLCATLVSTLLKWAGWMRLSSPPVSGKIQPQSGNWCLTRWLTGY